MHLQELAQRTDASGTQRVDDLDGLALPEEHTKLLRDFAIGSEEYSWHRRNVDGDALRQALMKGMQERNYTIAQTGRMIGLSSDSALYNFINHRSRSVSHSTALRLSQLFGFDLAALSEGPALPGAEVIASIEARIDQVGAPMELRQLVARLKKVVAARAINVPVIPLPKLRAELLMVSVSIDDEGPRGSLMLPAELQEPLTGRMSSRDAGRRAFGARVVGNVAEPAYKAGTVLICVPTSYLTPLRPEHGRRVLTCVRSARPAEWRTYTVELRKIAVDAATSRAELLPLGTNTSVPLEMPNEVYLKPWTSRGYDVKVAGLVISSVISEEGD